MKSEHLVQVLEEKNITTVIKKISEQQEEAFFVGDLGDVVDKFYEIRKAMPRVVPFYAMKCNDHQIILETLAGLGAGFDCASTSEMAKIKELNVENSRIILAHPAKPLKDIRFAAKHRIDLTTFDSESELYKMKSFFPKAKLVIRIVSDAKAIEISLSGKFGCDPVMEAPELLKLAKLLDLNVVGVSFHVGSPCREPEAFRRAIIKSKKIFDFASSIGYDFNFLDIGGGFSGSRKIPIYENAEMINKSLDEFFPSPSMVIISEPGRFFVESAFTLACSIYSIKTFKTKENQKHIMYYINDGAYGSFLFNVQHNLPIPNFHTLKKTLGQRYNSSIWGQTCDAYDNVIKNKILPEMKIGDWIIFEEFGAYTITTSTSFNGYSPSEVHYICDKSKWSLIKDFVPKSRFIFEEPNSVL